MALSTADIFAGLALLAFLVGAAAVVYVRKQSPPAPVASPGETGRHHVPRGLLDDPTRKLKPPY